MKFFYLLLILPCLFVVNLQAQPVITTDHYDITCFGNCNGSASVSVTGGTPPYYYMWSNGSYNSYINWVCEGEYYVTVTDALGMSAYDSVTISVLSPEMTVDDYVTDVSCYGSSDGTALLDISGGTEPITVYWYSPLNQEGDSVGDLPSGTYSYEIYDYYGCYLSGQVFIGSPSELFAGYEPIHPSSCGSADGEVILYASGGVSPYTYSWGPNAGNQTTEFAVSLSAGIYHPTITDATGCTAIEEIILTDFPQIDVSFYSYAWSDVTCNGGSDGAAVAGIDGVLPPVTFSWSDGTTGTSSFTSDTLDGLAAGYYYVTIEDTAGCSNILTVTINEPAPVTTGLTYDNYCYGAGGGFLNISPGGGYSPYDFTWSNGSLSMYQYDILEGEYIVTVTDGYGCSIIDTAIIIEYPELTADLEIIHDCDGNGGSLVFTATGGLPPYWYSPDGEFSDTTGTIAGLSPGEYWPVVMDDAGCSIQFQYIFIYQNPFPLDGSVTGTTNPVCFGECTGSAAVSITGGSPPYDYLWNDPGAQTDNPATALCAGIYEVTATDTLNCPYILSVEITQPDSLTADIYTTDIECYGESSGSAFLSVTGGGMFPYSYSWSTGETAAYTDQLTAGDYFVTVTDANGCIYPLPAITIGEPSELTTIITTSDVTCYGAGNGLVILDISGGTPAVSGSAYTFFWNTGDVIQNISGLEPGAYSVTVTDSLGCTAFNAAEIFEPDSLYAQLTVTNSNCGSTDGTATLSGIYGGTGPYSWIWTNGETDAGQITGLSAGNYAVTVTDSNGCARTFDINVGVQGTNMVNITASQILCHGGTGQAEASMPDGIPPFTYSWSDGQATPLAVELTSGIYSVTVSDSIGCTGQDSVVIDPAPEQLTVFMNSSGADCLGCNGTASAAPDGGVPPYTFLWSNDGTDLATTDLCGDSTYYITITDNNGCSVVSGALITSEVLPVLEGVLLHQQETFAAGDISVELYTPAFGSLIELELAVSVDNEDGGYFQFPGIAPDVYYIRTAKNNNTHPGLINTYYANTYSWNTATPVIVGCNDSISLEVYMYSLPQPGGATGSVSGTIRYYIDNKFVGDPVPGAEVYIEQEPNDEPVAASETDTSGYYNMGGIPYGDNYRIVVDIPGYPLLSTYSGISISFSDTSVEDMNFYVDSATIGGIFIDSASSVTVFNRPGFSVCIYPNPFRTELNIDYTLTQAETVRIDLFDETGKQVSTLVNDNRPEGKYRLKHYFTEKDAACGIYYLVIQANSECYVKKIVRN